MKSFRSHGRKIIRAVDTALASEAASLAAAVAAAAPEGVTGELRGSVHAEAAATARHRVVIDSDHAIPVEFGTSRMAAEPFARPTFDAREQSIIRNVANAARRA